MAIGFGSLIGALLVGGIWTANNAIKSQPVSLISAEPVVSSIPEGSSSPSAPTKTLPLTIITPTDLSLVTSNATIVEGKTSAYSNLIIQTESGDYYFRSDSQGTFSKEIKLVSGSNDITISVLSDIGDLVQKTVTVVYSTTAI